MKKLIIVLVLILATAQFLWFASRTNGTDEEYQRIQHEQIKRAKATGHYIGE